MAIGTLAELKVILGIASSDTTEDTLLNQLLTEVSDLIEDWLERAFGSTTYTEIYSGNGRQFLPLNYRPVTSITSLYLDTGANWGSTSGAFDSTTLLTSGTDYALVVDQPGSTTASASGMVANLNGVWPLPFTWTPGRISALLGPPSGNIKITYVAGEAAPSRICLACYEEIAVVRNMMPRGQVLASESYGDGAGNYSYSLATKPKVGMLSAECCAVLARYRNVAVA